MHNALVVMPASEPLRIFISYARKDGADLAQHLQASLADAGFDIWLDTQRLRGGGVWSVEIEHELDTREVTIALLSPGSYASEICRAEQLRALDKGNRDIPVLAIKGSDRPLYLYARQYRDFTNADEYNSRLSELIGDIRGDATATIANAYLKSRVTYLIPPPRVSNYLERPEALRALRDILFAEDHRQPIALCALAGMGGIGKTVLAKALTDDPVARRAFPDGIVWITAGKERKRDFIEEMREVAKALGDDVSGYDTPLACENRYRTTIAEKAALIIVDDVWSKTDIEPLLAESPRSRFLFTTRDASIGRFVGARNHRADLLDILQSRELLASWANVPVAKFPPAADNIIRECGQLPLALSVVGAMLRDAQVAFWGDTLELLRKADLSTIQDQLPAGQQSFYKAVEVSFQSLKPALQDHYTALAVLLDDMTATLPILQMLWDVSESEARRISRRLVDLSLAHRGQADEGIRLHDLQLDYVRALYPDCQALELIHSALRLSSQIIDRDPGQFASQMIGRLFAYRDLPAINGFTERLSHGAKNFWLRPMQPALRPPRTPLVRTLEGHTGWIESLALSGDGRRAISGSRDGTLKVWDVDKGRLLCDLAGHRGRVYGVAISQNGERAISASADKTLRLWEVETARELCILCGHSGWVADVAIDAEGTLAISMPADEETLKVWNLEIGRELLTLKELHAVSIAMSANRRFGVSVSADAILKV